MNIPFSAAADRNKEPILKVLKELIESDDRALLEIGSGTGQHGIYFSRHFPELNWTLSDVEEHHSGILAALNELPEQERTNITGPLAYQIGKDPLPRGRFDLAYTSNTFHIMSWKLVKTLIKSLGMALRPGARFIVYGPFKYHDKETSPSNIAFDEMLKERDAASGIRYFEDVRKQMESKGFRLLKDYEMPANNRALAFIKM